MFQTKLNSSSANKTQWDIPLLVLALAYHPLRLQAIISPELLKTQLPLDFMGMTTPLHSHSFSDAEGARAIGVY